MTDERQAKIIELSEAINREFAPRPPAPLMLDAGIHDLVPMGHYVTDMLRNDPSLSTKIVRTLIERTPAHARTDHPRFGPSEGEVTRRGELGSAVHVSVTGGQAIEYVEDVARRSGKSKGETFVPTDWATKDAQEAAEAIRARGNLPMLPHHRGLIEGAADAIRRALAQFGPGRFEQTLLWQEVNGVWCRGRTDYVDDAGLFDIDFKTCNDANPAEWARFVMETGGYHYQAGLRMRGHERLGRPRRVLFLLVELEPPHATSFVGLTELRRAEVDYDISRAVDLWHRCLTTGEWPAYGNRVLYAAPRRRFESGDEIAQLDVAPVATPFDDAEDNQPRPWDEPSPWSTEEQQK